jgi:hypothetical protein
MMPPFLARQCRLLALPALCVSLAACASQSLPAAPIETSPLAGKITAGTVASIRPVDIESPSGALTTVNAVMTALGEQAVRAPVHDSEVVVEKDNHSAISLAVPETDLTPGNQVSVVEAATTSLHRD